MKDKTTTTVNKYGKTVTLPPTTKNRDVMKIAKILEDAHIPYELEYKFDEDGCRRSPFDIAVMKDGEPRLFIEYDGESHYRRSFYEGGTRPEREMPHVVRNAIGDAKKTMIALNHNIPILRITPTQDDALRDRVLGWVEICVNDANPKQGNEVIMIDMLDKYGFDFDYVPPSDSSRAEAKRVSELFSKEANS